MIDDVYEYLTESERAIRKIIEKPDFLEEKSKSFIRKLFSRHTASPAHVALTKLLIGRKLHFIQQMQIHCMKIQVLYQKNLKSLKLVNRNGKKLMEFSLLA